MTMKAVQITNLGQPLELREVPQPIPAEGEVLVRVMAAGICHSDVHYREGVSPVAGLPLTPGHEVAGIVVDLGGPSQEHEGRPQSGPGGGPAVGDRVCIHYLVTCGRCEMCLTGREQWCDLAEMIGKDRDGGYAEYIAAPARNAVRIPDEVNDEHAAVMMCASATSLHALRKARIKPGDNVAVFGCGGLGASAIQIARILGASEVFGVDLHPDKLELATSLGAVPIDASKSDPSEIIHAVTQGVGVDVALELIGRPETVQQAVRSVAIRGRIAVVGITNEPVGVNPYTELIGREAEVIGVSDHQLDEIEELLQWASDGTFDLSEVVTDTVELDPVEINAVHDALARGMAAARTVILPLLVLITGLLLGLPCTSRAQQADTTEPRELKVKHGGKGFEFESADGDFLLQIDSRIQFRYAYPSDTDPVSEEDFIDDDQHILKVNRARLKVGGHAFKTWFKYYWEYDLVGSNLLDFRIMVERFPWLKLKIGQWKIHYSRERIISSGKQQLADRSIINRVFTIDRQQGLSLFGRLEGGGALDFSYWLSALMGTGRGAGENDDDHLMWMARGQWNPLGRVVPFEGSDTRVHKSPALLLAVAGVTNQSPYTRFSTSGGGNFEGDPGLPGQFRVDQVLIESAFVYRGLSWQHESHWKRVDDTINNTQASAVGSYFQGGYFPGQLLEFIPAELEIAGRYAYYIPDTDVDDDRRDEFTLAFNWFFRGHRNKLTAEISSFDLVDSATGKISEEFRVRLQWDVSL
jgi:D-arabinose 1-dehydrogenase-like Zn-dependent alcohol dehydrogenase